MWKSFLSVAILFSCVQSHASFVPPTECEGASKTHVLRFKQENSDVRVELVNKDFTPSTDFRSGGTPNKTYKVKTAILSIEKVEKANLLELTNSPNIKELITAMMYGRPEFDGEADMVYYYASELLQAMNCK
jgi:hypothetical protein